MALALTSMQPAVLVQHLPGLFTRLVIALEDGWPPHADLHTYAGMRSHSTICPNAFDAPLQPHLLVHVVAASGPCVLACRSSKLQQRPTSPRGCGLSAWVYFI